MKKYFITGLLIWIPIVVTIWVLKFIFDFLDQSLLLLPVAIAGWPAAAPGLGPSVAVAVLGVVGTGVAFAIFYELVATIGPGRAYSVTYIAPAFAVVYGAILLSEPITVATVIGLVLIVAGSYLAARRPRDARRPREGPGAAPAKAVP